MDFTNAPRRSFDLTVPVTGTPEAVFPLLCPVREYDWIPGWAGEIIYSRSGIAELGCVFSTRHATGEELWTVSRYQPPTAIGFVRVLPGIWTVLMDLDLSPAEGSTTALRVRHTFTALGPDGEAALRDLDGHPAQWHHLAELAGHYLRTGTMLQPPAETARTTSADASAETATAATTS